MSRFVHGQGRPNNPALDLFVSAPSRQPAAINGGPIDRQSHTNSVGLAGNISNIVTYPQRSGVCFQGIVDFFSRLRIDAVLAGDATLISSRRVHCQCFCDEADTVARVFAAYQRAG